MPNPDLNALATELQKWTNYFGPRVGPMDSDLAHFIDAAEKAGDALTTADTPPSEELKPVAYRLRWKKRPNGLSLVAYRDDAPPASVAAGCEVTALYATPQSATPSAEGEVKCPKCGGSGRLKDLDVPASFEHIGTSTRSCFQCHGSGKIGPDDAGHSKPVAIPPVTDEVRAPDGWKLVPVEPTREMLLAAYDRSRDGTTPLHFKTWASMLSASPEPPRAETAAPDSGEGE